MIPINIGKDRACRLKAEGYTHVAVATQAYGDYKRGDIITRYRSEQRALSHSRNNKFALIVSIDTVVKTR